MTIIAGAAQQVRNRAVAASGINFVGSNKQTSATGADTTLVLPTHAANHYGIITWFASPNASVTMTTPTGWTSVRQDSFSPGAGDDSTSAGIFVRRFTSGSETNPAMSTNTSDPYVTAVHVFSGVTTAGTALEALDATTTYATAVDIWAPTPPSITAATGGALVFMWFGESNANITTLSAPSAPPSATIGESQIGVEDAQIGHAYTVVTSGLPDVRKSIAGQAWNAGVILDTPIVSGNAGKISGVMEASNRPVEVGVVLASQRATLLPGSGDAYIYGNVAAVLNFSASNTRALRGGSTRATVSSVSGDVFEVQVATDQSITYLVAGNVIDTEPATAAGESLYPFVLLSNELGGVSNIQVDGLSNTWDATYTRNVTQTGGGSLTVTPSAFGGTGTDANKTAIQNYTMALKPGA